MEQALLPVLTPEQQRVFLARKATRDTSQPAKIWVRGSNGEPEARSIRLGMTDGRFAEVISGQLTAGEHVITGARKAKSK
jgi:multidrug efflux pump subunit AcrA (membrane-fusion protein)